MNKLLAALLLTSSMASPLIAHAEVDAAAARGLMQETGLWESLTEVPAALRQGVQAGMAGAGGMMPADASQRLLQAVDAAFTVERAQATALEAMRKGLDPATLTAVRKWQATPLGQRVLAQEKASAANTDQAKRMADGQAELQKADEPRRKVVAEIVDATKAVDAMGEISMGTALTMVRGMMAANPAAQGLPPEDQLRSMLQGQLAAARQQMQTALSTNMAFTYASFSTTELQQYLEYLRSPVGMKFNDLTLAAIAAVLKDGSEEMSRRLAAPAKAPGA